MLPKTHRTFKLRQGLLVHALVLALAQIRAVVSKRLMLLLLLLLLRLLGRRAFVRIVATPSRRLIPVRRTISVAVVVLLGLPHWRRCVPIALDRGSCINTAAAAVIQRRLVGIKSQAILVVRLVRHDRTPTHYHLHTISHTHVQCTGIAILWWHLLKDSAVIAHNLSANRSFSLFHCPRWHSVGGTQYVEWKDDTIVSWVALRWEKQGRPLVNLRSWFVLLNLYNVLIQNGGE